MWYNAAVRVLTVGNLYPPHDLGGGYELVWSSAVAHLRAQGHAVRVLATDYRSDNPKLEEQDVHRDLRWYWQDHAYPRRSLLWCARLEGHNARVMARHLAAFEPSVVAWWAMGGMSLSLLQQARRAGLPAVAFVHDDWLDYGRRADGWHRRSRRNGVVAACMERLGGVPATVDFASAARYLFVSEHTRAHALDSNLWLPETGVLNSGIDPDFIGPSDVSEWGWRLLYVGRLDERKGIATAIEALAHLPRAATLTIVGDGDPQEVEGLRRHADAVGASERVRFAGRKAPSELPATYDAADAVLFPVVWREPWGLIPLEAMARGRPVVATGRGGSAEYLRHGENCLLFAAGDAEDLAGAIDRLAKDSPLRSRLRDRGLDTARRHTRTAFNEAVERELGTALSRPERSTLLPSVRPAGDVPRLSVVIPTYRRHEILSRTLDALAAQTVPSDDFEVIVVDDPKEDDPGAVAAAIAPDERPFHSRQLHRGSPGVSAARNVGWRAALAPLVLFLGDDIIARRDLLAEHLAWHERHGDGRVAVLGHVTWARGLDVTPFMRWLEEGAQFDYRRIEGIDAGWGRFYTSNVSLKRSLLEKVDGFDETFPFLYEDTELAYRLSREGMRLLYNRRARAEHLHDSTLEQWKARMAGAARAEYRVTRLHPALQPWFKDRLEDAARRPAHRGRTGRYLARWIPPRLPLIGKRVWDNATICYRQQLAPAFLEAWHQEAGGGGPETER